MSTKGSPHFFKTFYLRRVVRIFPLYYGVVIIDLLLVPLLLHRPVILARLFTFLFYGWNIAYTFHVAAWVHARVPVLPGHFWSLCIEEQFYLFWPLLVFLLDKKHFIKALAIFVLVSIVSRIVLLSLGFGVFYFTLCRLDALSLGAMLAVAFPDPQVMGGYVRRAAWALVAMVACFAPLYVLFSGARLPVVQVFKYTAVAAVYVAVLVMVVGAGKASYMARFFNSRFLRFSGKLSYALYVFHPFVYFFVSLFVARCLAGGSYRGISWVFAVQLPASFALTFLMAFLSWHLYEKQFLKLKRHFEYAPAVIPAGPANVSP